MTEINGLNLLSNDCLFVFIKGNDQIGLFKTCNSSLASFPDSIRIGQTKKTGTCYFRALLKDGLYLLYFFKFNKPEILNPSFSLALGWVFGFSGLIQT
jgi:hypothetical protein